MALRGCFNIPSIDSLDLVHSSTRMMSCLFPDALGGEPRDWSHHYYIADEHFKTNRPATEGLERSIIRPMKLLISQSVVPASHSCVAPRLSWPLTYSRRPSACAYRESANISDIEHFVITLGEMTGSQIWRKDTGDP